MTNNNLNLPMLKECCCGCTLKTGTMIIGFLSLVAAVIVSCITIISLVKMQQIKHNNILDIALGMILMSIRTVQIILSIFLIIGSHKGRPSFVCPWLILSLFLVLIESFYALLKACELIAGKLNTQIFSLCTHIAVTIYFMLVVFSHYRELQQRKETAKQFEIGTVHYNAKTGEVQKI